MQRQRKQPKILYDRDFFINYYNVDGGTSTRVGAASVTFSTSGTFNEYTLSGAIDTFGDCLYILQF